MPTKVIVAIPAKNEAARIAACLTALDAQQRRPDGVVLLLNNTTDGTEQIARALQPALRYDLDVTTLHLPPHQANAGHARRRAMALAAQAAGPTGILLTTDADGTAPPDWIRLNLTALRQGADVVCGKADIDARDAALIPEHLHADDAAEQHLIGLLDQIAWALDPEPHDPLPRHTEASGASIAVTAAAFHRVGGIPDITSGEDRAFVRALWLIDAKVRHDPSIRVTVSGRVEGRAQGGMADTIRRRMIQQDTYADDQAEPAQDAFRRYALRARARRAWAGGMANPALCAAMGLRPGEVVNALVHPHFGTAWAALESASPLLKRQRVRFASLPAEIDRARALLRQLTVPETMAAE